MENCPDMQEKHSVSLTTEFKERKALMKPFTYLSPETLEQAFDLYVRHGDSAKYMAGGTDVIVKLKDGWLSPEFIISLKKIKDLALLQKDDATGGLSIGAMVTHSMLEKSEMIKKHYPIIHDAVSKIGSVQIRNAGTIGGNLINAVPSADGAIPMIALDGTAVIKGPEKERSVMVKDLFIEPYRTVLKPGEILTKIIIPACSPNTGSAYIKFGRRAAMELPLIGIGVLISLDDNKETCTKARICLGVAGPVPMRAYEAEKLLEGSRITPELLDRAGEKAAEESRVRDSVRGKAWHRKEMIKVQVRRMGLRCLDIIQNNS